MASFPITSAGAEQAENKVTLAEVLSNAKKVIEKVEETEEVLHQAVKDKNESNLAEAEDDDNLDKDTAVKPSTPEKIASNAARAMVENIRLFGSAALYNNSDEAAFADKFKAAVELVQKGDEGDIVTLFSGDEAIVTLVGKAIRAAFEAKQQNPSLKTYLHKESEFEVTIAGDRYSIKDISSEAGDPDTKLEVDITATVVVNEENISVADVDSQSLESNSSVDADIQLNGVIQTPAIALTIHDGSVLKGSLDLDEKEEWDKSAQDKSSESESESIDAPSVEMLLNATLASLTGSDPISFEGKISANVTGLKSTTESQEQSSSSENGSSSSGNGKETLTAASLELALMGTFSTSDESFKAAVMLDLDNPNGFVHEESWDWTDTWNDGQHSSVENSSSNDESADKYVKATLSIDLEFDLAGVDENTGVFFSAERTGLSAAKTSLEVKINDDRLLISSDLQEDDGDDVSGTVTVTDQHSNVLTLMPADNGDLTGNIKVDDKQVATISEEKDVITIRYEDGGVESL